MNTPQSPFAPLQKLQEERNEGWMTEMITPTAEEKERADFEKSYRKAYPDADADIFSRQEDGHYFNLFVNGMWKLWKDFSASQEVRLGEIAALPQKWRSRPAVMSWNPAIDCIFELEAALLPRPTAEAVSKADFERFARGEGYSLAKNAKDEFRDTAAIHGWKLWQAARAAKEGEK